MNASDIITYPDTIISMANDMFTYEIVSYEYKDNYSKIELILNKSGLTVEDNIKIYSEIDVNNSIVSCSDLDTSKYYRFKILEVDGTKLVVSNPYSSSITGEDSGLNPGYARALFSYNNDSINPEKWEFPIFLAVGNKIAPYPVAGRKIVAKEISLNIAVIDVMDRYVGGKNEKVRAARHYVLQKLIQILEDNELYLNSKEEIVVTEMPFGQAGECCVASAHILTE